MRKGILPLFVCLVLAVLSACTAGRKISNQNLASLYTPDLNFTFPKFRYYNFSTDSSRLYFRFPASDFLAVSSSADGQFSISADVLIVIHPSYESKVTLDSSGMSISVPVETDATLNQGITYTPQAVAQDLPYSVTDDGFIEGSLGFRALNGTDYIAQVFVTDRNRRKSVATYFTVDRTGKQPVGDFLPTDEITGKVIVKNYFDVQDTFLLQSVLHPSQPVVYRYFGRNFPIAPPPYSAVESATLSYFSDQALQATALEEAAFPVHRHGIYHVQFDSLEKEGFTQFRFEEDFPNLTDVSSLLESVRYLTTREEYDKLLNSENKKEAIDEFWVSLSGNHERARVLIKNYYSRVQLANEWFTSYLEGWKSDRGLIFVIFGPPAAVYRDKSSESWNYSSSSSFGPLIFTFDKVINPFTDNDFRLRRSTNYEGPWYRAVDGWRDGRVMDGNN
jgi:GWxTD domain-containing protein